MIELYFQKIYKNKIKKRLKESLLYLKFGLNMKIRFRKILLIFSYFNIEV